MAQLDGGVSRTTPLVRKIGWTILTGFITFAGSALFDSVLHVALADQLVLTFIAGGVALLIQYLADFEQRLQESRRYQQRILQELNLAIDLGFAGVSEATTLMKDLETSALRKEALHQVIRKASLIKSTTKPLLCSLADSEVERLSKTLHAIAEGHAVFYEGEDRELLLALTRKSRKSIMATSWATARAYGLVFEPGFWLNDLGGRYLDLQRMARQRGVAIKRVFIYESPDLIANDGLRRILAMQQSAGVEVKLMQSDPIPRDGSIADFVLFDEELSYDTTSVAHGDASTAPRLLTTHLVLDEEIVRSRILRFQELWETASHPDRMNWDSIQRQPMR